MPFDILFPLIDSFGIMLALPLAAPTHFFVPILLVILLVAGVCAKRSSKSFIVSRVISETPTSLIRSAAQGIVELKGVAYGDTIKSFLSHDSCYWYRYTIYKKITSNNKTEWREIESGQSDKLIPLKDKTGACMLSPEEADISTSCSRTWYGSSQYPLEQKDTGDSIAASFAKLLGSGFKKYKYVEELIKPGNTLYALGLFTTKAITGKQEIHSKTKSLSNQWIKGGESDLFDTNFDGKLDRSERIRLIRAAKQVILEENPELKGVKLVNFMSESQGNPYLISTKQEHGVIKKYQAQAILYSIGFFAAGGYGAWLLQERLF